MRYDRPDKRKNHVKLLVKAIKQSIRADGGICEKVHGNSFQSGWPSVFSFHRNYGVRWLQPIGPSGSLTWQKLGRFRVWADHGVPIYHLSDVRELSGLDGIAPNWLTAPVRGMSKADTRERQLRKSYPNPKPGGGPEAQIASRIKHELNKRGWLFEKTWGSKFQSGWPDYYAHHLKHGYRWVETKAPKGRLEPTQYARFTNWEEAGVGVWILKSVDEIDLLFEPPNWKKTPRKKWNLKGLL